MLPKGKDASKKWDTSAKNKRTVRLMSVQLCLRLMVWPRVTSWGIAVKVFAERYGFKDIIMLHNVVTRRMPSFAAASPPAADDLKQRLPTQKVAAWWNECAEWPRWAIMRPAKWLKSRQLLQHSFTVRLHRITRKLLALGYRPLQQWNKCL